MDERRGSTRRPFALIPQSRAIPLNDKYSPPFLLSTHLPRSPLHCPSHQTSIDFCFFMVHTYCVCSCFPPTTLSVAPLHPPPSSVAPLPLARRNYSPTPFNEYYFRLIVIFLQGDIIVIVGPVSIAPPPSPSLSFSSHLTSLSAHLSIARFIRPAQHRRLIVIF